MNIVLMHGVLGFGRLFGVDYFNGVAQHLSKLPDAHILTTEVASIGKVPIRAAEAAEQITHPAAAAGFKADAPIHIIAHSMGGLDARWLISHNLESLQPRVRTLICLGTPHLGSPIASIIRQIDPFHFLDFAHLDSLILHELRSKSDAAEDLSQSAAQQFNQACPDIGSVNYFDVAGVGRKAVLPTSVPFSLLHTIVSHAAGGNDARNDGVVPFTSAARQQDPAAIWYADHADMVGHDLNGGAERRPEIDYFAAYDALVKKFILEEPVTAPTASGLVF